MLKSYEAIYDNGYIQWLGIAPQLKQARVLVIAESAADEEFRPTLNETTADVLLASTNGIWGHRSIAEVTAAMESQRLADWGVE